MNKRFWLNRLFPNLPCKHKTVLVEEDFESRYGCHTGYKYCLKCGRSAGEIGRHCEHEVDCFGVCRLCLDRITKFKCKHSWVNEPDTDEYYCEKCGEWKSDD